MTTCEPETPGGSCYYDAWKFVLRHDDCIIVHGTVKNPDGKVMHHAWAECDSLVWEPQTGEYLPRRAWGERVVSRDAAYSADEAAVLALKTGHSGPW